CARLTPLQVILDAPRNAQAPLRYEDLDAIDPFRFGIRKRFQQRGVNDTEYRGVRADAQRQRERGRGRETGRFEQHPRPIPRVPPEFFKSPKPAEVPILLLHLLDSAEAAPSRESRFFLAHPPAKVLRRLHLQMKAHFGVHLMFDLPPPPDHAQMMK